MIQEEMEGEAAFFAGVLFAAAGFLGDCLGFAVVLVLRTMARSAKGSQTDSVHRRSIHG